MTTSLRVAIVEDDTDLRQTTEEFLTRLGYAVWGVESAEAFYRSHVALPADVVVLDIGLPGEDGLGVTALLQGNPNIAVIIVSARDALEDKLAGLRAGADRYLVKPVDLLELAANIEAVAKRLPLLGNRLQNPVPLPTERHARTQDTAATQEPWRLNKQDWTLVAPSGNRITLTAREFQLMHHLCTAQGQTVPKKDLAHALFGQRVPNSIERTNVLLARLRRKAIEELGEELPIKTAHQIGYAFTAPAGLV